MPVRCADPVSKSETWGSAPRRYTALYTWVRPHSESRPQSPALGPPASHELRSQTRSSGSLGPGRPLAALPAVSPADPASFCARNDPRSPFPSRIRPPPSPRRDQSPHRLASLVLLLPPVAALKLLHNRALQLTIAGGRRLASLACSLWRLQLNAGTLGRYSKGERLG